MKLVHLTGVQWFGILKQATFVTPLFNAYCQESANTQYTGIITNLYNIIILFNRRGRNWIGKLTLSLRVYVHCSQQTVWCENIQMLLLLISSVHTQSRLTEGKSFRSGMLTNCQVLHLINSTFYKVKCHST